MLSLKRELNPQDINQTTFTPQGKPEWYVVHSTYAHLSFALGGKFGFSGTLSDFQSSKSESASESAKDPYLESFYLWTANQDSFDNV